MHRPLEEHDLLEEIDVLSAEIHRIIAAGER
jgi:hypothetical protein